MGSRFIFRHGAPFDWKFDVNAFARVIGSEISVAILGLPRHGRVITAEVIENGDAVLIEFDVSVELVPPDVLRRELSTEDFGLPDLTRKRG